MISSYIFHLLLGVGLCVSVYSAWGFPGGSVVKNLPANAGAVGSISGLGRYPGKGNGYPLQYSCLENPMDGGTWRAIVHGVRKSRKRLSDFTFTFNKTIFYHLLKNCIF